MPTVQLNEQAPRRQLPDVGVPGAAYVGRGLDELADTFQRIQNGADAAEKLKLEGQASAGFQGLIQKHELETADPEEYKAALQEALPTFYKETLEQASNPRVRRAVEASLADNYGRAQKVAELGYFKKKQDKMAGDFVIAKDDIIQASIGASDKIRAELDKKFSESLAQMVYSGGMKYEEAAKHKVAFRKEVESQTMNLAAAQQPQSFYQDFNAGKFSGNDDVAVQRALDIAERSTNAREAKIEHDTKWASREAERAYIGQAEKHQLNVRELEDVGAFYQWSDDKIDKIKRIQLGLRESNPNSDKLIADALDSINKPDPNMRDVDTAAQRLIGLSDKVSPDSAEYRTAMNKIASLRRSVRSSSEIGANRAEREQRKAQVDAKRSVTQLMNKFDPRLRPDRRKAQLGDWYDQIDGMEPGAARSFVEQQRKEYETKLKAKDPNKLDIEQFKSLKR